MNENEIKLLKLEIQKQKNIIATTNTELQILDKDVNKQKNKQI